jgi:WD40 repeat protein
MLTKTGIRCPITAIDCVNHNEFTFLFWANGGNLHVDVLQPLSYNFTSEYTIFNNHNIRGVKSRESVAKSIVFGDKSFAIVSWTNFEITKMLTTDVYLHDLNDLILDCNILDGSTNNLSVLVGYAHNFLDLFHISANSSVTKVWRVQCPDAGALFSMSIHMRNDEILIASGTVFGKVIVWKVVKDSEEDQQIPRACVLRVVHRHEGVVFRIIWSHCATKMLTVSDDRTARLWDVTFASSAARSSTEIEDMTERFVAWGHVSRVWDAAFLNHPGKGEEQTQEIATCSEDGTVKLWRCDAVEVDGGCIATLRGHSSDVWRLATAFDNKVVISCGNDAAVKLWDVAFHKQASPEQTASGCRVMRFPALALEAPTELDEQMTAKNHNHNCRRANGVCFVKTSFCGSLVAVVMIDGTVWQVRLVSAEEATDVWTVAARLNKAITSADVEFVSEVVGGPVSHLRIAVAHVDGTNCYLHRPIVFGDEPASSGNFGSFDKFEWKAHALRTVNLWFCGAYLVTASLKGACSLWALGSVGSSHVLRRAFEAVTGSGEIATSCCHVRSKRSFLVVGDSRGGVSAFDLSRLSIDISDSPTVCPTSGVDESRFFPRVHGSDPVSCIAQCDNGFVTAGHDGHVAIFRTVVGASRWDWEVVNRVQSLPVTTPDILIVSEEGDAGTTSLLVGGYFGHLYIVWDLLRSVQLLRIEGGGWKRPHHCSLHFSSISGERTINTLPRVLFVCPAPAEKGQTVLQVFGARPAVISSHATTSSLPLQVRSSALGRVCYCNVLLQGAYQRSGDGALVVGERYLVVGGEEGRVKVFSAADLSPRQELVLPSNASLKALSCCSAGEDKSRGVVAGGGGKLVFSVWTYDYQSAANDGQPLQQVLSRGCEGKLWPRATQDHRVLSVQCTFLSETQDDGGTASYRYLVVFSDSRGVATVALFTHCPDASPRCAFEILQELQVSSCPVISSCITSLRLSQSSDCCCQYIVCCFGDTSGVNRLFLMAPSRLVGG